MLKLPACRKHPRFNPAREGEGGIKAGCFFCYALLAAYRAFEDSLSSNSEHAPPGSG